MIASLIKLVISQLPLILFLASFVLAAAGLRGARFQQRLLFWLLLLSVGVEGVWAGIFHIFFPAIASGSIGWAPSPFEREIGIADLAFGVTAIVSCWRSFEFKAAVIVYAIIFYVGVAIGHFYEAAKTRDFAGNNFGVLLIITLVQAVVLACLYFAEAKRRGTADS